MKFKNTLLSVVRMALVSCGTYLASQGKISADDVQLYTGAIIGALGMLWDAKDEHSAENPGFTLPKPPPAALMILFSFLALGVASTFTGCAGSPFIAHPPGTSAFDPVTVEKNATRLAKGAALIVLTSDPEEASELQKIADRIDVVIVRGTLTPEQIALFLDALDVKPRNRLLVAALVTELTGIFTELTGQTLPDISHPLASATLRGVKAGIADALALQAAVQPAGK